MDAREAILEQLRGALADPALKFPSAAPRPLESDVRMAVTSAQGDRKQLVQRFAQELEALHGTVDIVETATEARLTLLNRLITWMNEAQFSRKGSQLKSGQERMVLSWAPDALPVPGLAEALADIEIELVYPADLQAFEPRERVRLIRYGLTGVDAAFASTGSMLFIARPQTSRSASLLPQRHIALIPTSRLYPTVEDWLGARRADNSLVNLLRDSANVSMVTGPSKSADIGGSLTLGVHGPKMVHAIVFDD